MTALSYHAACAAVAARDAAVREAAAGLKAIPNIGSGPMGLTPDAVRATPEYRAAKAAYDRAFAAQRRLNGSLPAAWKRDMAADRHAARAERARMTADAARVWCAS